MLLGDAVTDPPGERFALVAAAHLFLLDGERVLLSLRHNTGYADGQWSVVAGHLDGNETAVMAISREAREEADIALAPDNLVVVGIMHRRAEGLVGRERLDFFLNRAGLARHTDQPGAREVRGAGVARAR